MTIPNLFTEQRPTAREWWHHNCRPWHLMVPLRLAFFVVDLLLLVPVFGLFWLLDDDVQPLDTGGRVALVALSYIYVPILLGIPRVVLGWRYLPEQRMARAAGKPTPSLREDIGHWLSRPRTAGDALLYMAILTGGAATVIWIGSHNPGPVYALISYLDKSPAEEITLVQHRVFDRPRLLFVSEDKISHVEVSPVGHPEVRMTFRGYWNEGCTGPYPRLMIVRAHRGLLNIGWHRESEDRDLGNIHAFEAALPGKPPFRLDRYRGKIVALVETDNCHEDSHPERWLPSLLAHPEVQLVRGDGCEPPRWITDKSPWLPIAELPEAQGDAYDCFLRRAESWTYRHFLHARVVFFAPDGRWTGSLKRDRVTPENIQREIERAKAAAVASF